LTFSGNPLRGYPVQSFSKLKKYLENKLPIPHSEQNQDKQNQDKQDQFHHTSRQELHTKFENLKLNFDLLDLGVSIDIQELNLSGKRLKTLPENFKSLESLRSLNLSKNLLVRFDFEFLNLTYLDLSGNLIEYFNGECLENIVELNLNNNKLKAIPMVNNVCNLWLSDNQITNIDLDILAQYCLIDLGFPV
jgi:Leucine-rich repeat (LRR) protein